MTPSLAAPVSLTEILHNQVYIGNLSAALSEQHRKSVGVTHILSVCPDYPSTGESHLTINVQDSEYEDLLIHLPRACQFIEDAVSRNGKVLVHCVMGVSRSTTVVAAYLMKSRGMDAASAIQFIKNVRPQAHPNYGFVTQLVTFAACLYTPSPENSTYRTWKRKQNQSITAYLNYISDSTTILPDKLLLSSGFPEDPVQAEALIQDLGVTHLLTISPSCRIPPTIPTSTTLTRYQHLTVSDLKNGDLLVALPDACKFVARAISEGGLVLIHCSVESRACIVVCASLMEMKNISPEQSFSILEDALPLFNPTRNFSRHLELFASCGYNPTRDHHLVQDWIMSQSQDPYSLRSVSATTTPAASTTNSTNSIPPSPFFARSSSSFTSSTVSSPGPSTPSSSRTSSASGLGGPGPLFGGSPLAKYEQDQDQGQQSRLTMALQKPRRHGLPPSLPLPLPLPFIRGNEGDGFNGVSSDLVMHAVEMLKERYSDPDARESAPFDLTAFGKVLAGIQEREERAGRC